MNIKEKAAALWTELVVAMRSDGLIAQCIHQSGPATTAVIVKAVSDDATWMPMTITPMDGREVVAIDTEGRLRAPVSYENERKKWFWNGSTISPDRFLKWRFVRLPEDVS